AKVFEVFRAIMEFESNERLQIIWSQIVGFPSGPVITNPINVATSLGPVPLSNPATQHILPPELMEQVCGLIDDITKSLAKSEAPRISLGKAISWSELANVMITLRNQLFMIYGSGMGGVT
ncbi:hypothetical protein HK096_001334, partial [Nowakowskiella sp. JEL0078]